MKPANVLLDSRGEPKVTDFGLAKKMETDSGLTRTGSIMGTPSYMPPEQAAGKTDEVGPLADVYSLGAILYCMLTGRPPFQAANPLDTLLQVMEREPVTVTSLNAQVPKDLETICHKCLQKEPAKRYQSANDLGEDLCRWQRGEPIQARAVSGRERAWRWVKRNPKIAALSGMTILSIIAGTVLSLVFGFHAQRESELANAARKETEAALASSNFTLAKLELDRQRPLNAARYLQDIPPEYRQLEWDLGSNCLYSGDLEVCSHAGSVDVVKFSPDGRFIASASGEAVIVSDANTLDVLLKLELPEEWYSVRDVSFSAGGRFLAVAGHGITASAEELGSKIKIQVFDLKSGKVTVRISDMDWANNVEFSPDGSELVGCTGSDIRMGDYTPKNSVVVWSVASGTRKWSLDELSSPVVGVQYLDGGDRILMTCAQKVFVVRSPSEKEELPVDGGGFGFDQRCSISPDEKFAISKTWDEVAIVDLATGKTVKELPIKDRSLAHLQLTADGKRIVGVDGNRRIVVWNAGNGTIEQESDSETSPIKAISTCPEGRRLVSGHENGIVKIWRISSLKSGRRRLTLEQCRLAASSPDGRVLWGCTNDSICGWDSQQGTLSHRYPFAKSVWISAMRVNGETNSAVVALNARMSQTVGTQSIPMGAVQLWDLQSGKLLHDLCKNTAITADITISPDGQRIACSMADGTVTVWDGATGDQLHNLQVRGSKERHDSIGDKAHALMILPDGKTLIAATAFNLMRGQTDHWQDAIISPQKHNAGIICLCTSSDGRIIASGDQEGRIVVWNSETLEPLQVLEEGDGDGPDVCQMAIVPNQQRLVSISGDGDLIIWDLRSSRDVFRLKLEDADQSSSVYRGGESVVFLPNTLRMAVGTPSGLILLNSSLQQDGAICVGPWVSGHVSLSAGRLSEGRRVSGKLPEGCGEWCAWERHSRSDSGDTVNF